MHDEHYPRPQLRRAHWRDLGGRWAFAYDDGARWQTPDEVHFDREIIVPFPPESAASGVGDPASHPVVWYGTRVELTEDERPRPGERRLLLHFGAVDYRARVWVNGQLVAEHEGGHTPFSADVTALAGGPELRIVVRAEDDPHDLAQPRGKQDWKEQPHSIWYRRTTGIWQPVWLESVSQTYLHELRWTPDLDREELRLQVRLNGAPPHPLQLRVRLSLRGRPLAQQTVALSGRQGSAVLPLNHTPLNPERQDLLWSPRHPNLIDAEVALLSEDGAVVDEVRSYAGMRSVEVQGGRFLLNGHPYYLRLVLAQNYWPESHLATPSPEALRREAELVKALGFNGVRIHQKIEDPRFLYWCDRLGLLVWGEAANAYRFTDESCERLTREWLEALRRDYSHPCIVAWVPLNESWGVPNLERDPAQRAFVKGLYHLTRALDPTRPVVANDGWQHVAGDILGIHDYALEGAVLRERYGTPEAIERTFAHVQPHFRNLLTAGHTRGEEAVMLTEFGGLSIRPGEGERWWGYGTVGTPEAFLEKYGDLVGAVLDCESLAGFCYTQLTDTEQETNGLLTASRQPKFDLAAARAINTRPSRAVPGDVLNEIHQAAQEEDRRRLAGSQEEPPVQPQHSG
ncbi:glycoside hydrolase family 2 multidomain protein [Deinococcus geothermalis DSM 11300]|uniref:Glycoside hydrolase family 2 multidomain protein n=1 Tax=Deinococcus geothermalis (strain DSM 11300 / CIP 105573 / AG-3a) TaxID=319795 RepID=Q1IWI6_DEIGD|nr:glycoside hydrolase family 2 [Deinococcus geothermalis]ABF46398.1 glycoside hydrolase family 2 multidomain protein [Deinococcus geothermalis DSM 11300]